MGQFRRFHGAMHHADGSHFIKVRRAGSVDALVPLGENEQHAVTLLHIVYEFDGTLPPDCQRDHSIGKHHSVTNRQHRQFIGNGVDPLFHVTEIL
jgi:hypothetical protein